MRTPEEKQQHERRIRQKENHINRQMSIRRAFAYDKDAVTIGNKQPHRYHKLSGTTCGDSRCVMCGNPRKFYGEETIQERKHKQQKFYRDIDDNINFR